METKKIKARNPLFHAQALRDLSPEHRRLFIDFGKGPEVSRPYQCVHHAFECRAQERPEDIAVEHLGKRISYGELN